MCLLPGYINSSVPAAYLLRWMPQDLSPIKQLIHQSTKIFFAFLIPVLTCSPGKY